ncbi:hypothetical protein [Bosea sp. (in: a-proteobacteria)]|uniref:bestrophin-like domain n=1 Tax=Bosea sp. (in: a-proteobacteria) TaxID=1871050 RepID=UPI001AC3AEE4|nr:hypothetical protein [Bosea sp. (in: a-proteobacteria)]MBN9444364.1 hypothetical protein [Bosea sp. (in: a-proteobacteria)]
MEFLYGLGFLLLFGLSALAGIALRARLPEEHLSKENMEAVRLVTGLLVTFAALVLSLQLSTARATFDTTARNRSLYAAQLARLDRCLRDMGPELAGSRETLRRYVAAVIASTWPLEPAPAVPGMPDVRGMAIRGEDAVLAGMMEAVGLAIDTVAPAPGRAAVSARCQADYVALQGRRWAVIEDGNGPQGGVFVGIIGFWLALVFLSFGLQVPRRRLSGIVLGIGVISVASVMFVIVDLAEPYRGLFGIRSVAMRQALADMTR